MSTSCRFGRHAAAAISLAALVFSGCWKESIFWSPDGSRGAVITADGLYLTDAAGHLSPLTPGVYRAAWLADSQGLVLARKREITDCPTLIKTLGPERTRTLVAEAELVWQQLASSPQDDWTALSNTGDDADAIRLYLREFHTEAVLQKYSEKKRAQRGPASASWHSIVTARIVGDQLEIGATLREGLARTQELRPSPAGPAVAIVSTLELTGASDNGPHTFLAPIDGSSPAVLVASHTAGEPDWTPDGHTLVYLKAMNEHGSSGDLQLGSLVEREVLDASGHIALAEKTRDLAGLIFQPSNRVRCLRDGRVLFDAAELHLPMAEGDENVHEQLFAIDRTREKAPLVPLIPSSQLEPLSDRLTNFEVSPDQTQIRIGHDNDRVLILSLTTGKLEELKLELHSNGNPPLPVWGPGNGLVYLKKGGKRPELILRNGESETVLSRTWSDEMLKRLVD